MPSRREGATGNTECVNSVTDRSIPCWVFVSTFFTHSSTEDIIDQRLKVNRRDRPVVTIRCHDEGALWVLVGSGAARMYAVRRVPPELRLPFPTVGCIVQHPEVFPVVGLTRVSVVDG